MMGILVYFSGLPFSFQRTQYGAVRFRLLFSATVFFL